MMPSGRGPSAAESDRPSRPWTVNPRRARPGGSTKGEDCRRDGRTAMSRRRILARRGPGPASDSQEAPSAAAADIPRRPAPGRHAAARRGAEYPAWLGQAASRHQAVERAGHAARAGGRARFRPVDRAGRPGGPPSTDRRACRGHRGVHGARAGRRRPLSPASDWYSVGVMLYRALTGPAAVRRQVARRDDEEAALRPAAPRVVNPAVPEDLNDLCMDLLRSATRPNARPARTSCTGSAARRRPSATAGRAGRGRGTSSAAHASSRCSPRHSPRSNADTPAPPSSTAAPAPARARCSSSSSTDWSSAAGRSCSAAAATSRSRSPTRRWTRLIDSLTRYLRRLHRHEAGP